MDNKIRHEKICKNNPNQLQPTEQPTEQNNGKNLNCVKCNKSFYRKDNRKRHEVRCEGVNFKCRICQCEFSNIQELKNHQTIQHPQPSTSGNRKRNEPSTTQSQPSKKQKLNDNSIPSQPPPQKRQRAECNICDELCQNNQFIQYQSHYRAQHGGAQELQAEPWEEEAPWENEDGEIVDEPLRNIYEEHRTDILAHHNTDRVIHTYNFPTNNLQGGI